MRFLRSCSLCLRFDRELGALRDSLGALETIKLPGSMVDLPFAFPEGMENMNLPPPENPPIGQYVVHHPWHLVNYFRREVPSSVTP